jgi:MFS family permease
MKVDAGGANIPGGEFFGCPIEDSAEGVIAFTEFPAVYAGREVNGIRLRFEGGTVVDASAETNEAYLVEMLDSDAGARRLGELGIGCNPGITRYMRNTLFDEKIDGTVHLALGQRHARTSAGRTSLASTGTSSRTCGCPARGSSSTARSSSRTVRGCSDARAEPAPPAPDLRPRLRRGHLVARVADDLPRAAVVRPPDHGLGTRMGVVLAVELLPIAILGIPSGSVIARYGARRTMLVSDLIRAPLLASIPLLHELGMLSFPLLLAIVACIGTFLAPYFASQRLILPELVGRRRARGRAGECHRRGRDAATSLLGPAAAGLLIAVFDAPVVLYVDAATFLIAFALLFFLVPTRPPRPQSDDGRGVLAGIRFLLRDPLLRVLGLTALVANGLGQMLGAGLTVLAYEEYSSSKVAGAFFAAFGLGAVLGSIAAVRIVGRHDPLRLGASAFVILTLPIFALSLELPVPLS